MLCLCGRRQQCTVARHDAVAKVLTDCAAFRRTASGYAWSEGGPESGGGGKWLIDVAVVCPATKSVVARQYTQE
jgi:hypothetical protein